MHWINALKSHNGRNASFGAIAALANPAIQLAAMPVLFRGLGAEMFGVWMIINSISAASGIASLGFGAAATKFIAIHRSKADPKSVQKFAQTSVTILTLIGSIAAIALFFAAPALSQYVFKIQESDLQTSILSFRIAALVLFLKFVYSGFEAILRGFERYDVDALWGIFVAVGNAIVAMIIVTFNGGLPNIVIANVLLFCVALAGMGLSAHFNLNSWTFLLPRLHLSQLRKLLSFGVFSWIQSLNAFVFGQGDRLLVAAFLGTAVAGQYAVLVQIVMILHTVMARAVAFLFPSIAQNHSRGETHRLLQIFNIGTLSTGSIAWLFAIALIVVIHPLLSILMGPEFADASPALITPLALWSVLLSGSLVQTLLLNGSGLERFAAIASSATSITFLTSLYFLLPVYGITGAAFSRLISLAPSLISRSVLIKQLFPFLSILAGPATWLPVAFSTLIFVLIGNYSNGAITFPSFTTGFAAFMFSTLVYGSIAASVHLLLLRENR